MLTHACFQGKYNEPIYSTIRRMAVLSTFDQYSWCLAISPYGGRGIAKPGVDPSKHAIIHMSDTQPKFMLDEPRMVKEPLAAISERPGQTLHSQSRINLGNIYTVEHNVKVLRIGRISPESMGRFVQYARDELSF
ncbi:hypothetical protein BJY01DRAFT_238930 [Aspergillus pseudoustus]|uniref:DUF6590 domain-containing protein n=1 Tax=Aspergillus pseudoustus TaxID=1810923 RepID=A0ABR4J8E4_9EURO